MQFHISNVLSDFDARFDDAMLRRPFIGRRQGDHGSRGRVSPHNSPGHPAYAPSGSSSRGKVSPENSPGHPANAPGGGVDTGDHDGDEKYGSDASSSSSSRGKVSPENSPGHPAQRTRWLHRQHRARRRRPQRRRWWRQQQFQRPCIA